MISKVYLFGVQASEIRPVSKQLVSPETGRFALAVKFNKF